MKIKQLLEKWDDFDEHFIRSVAKDRGVDLSSKSTEEVRRMHDQIVGNIHSDLNDHDMGQEYYDMTKQYFSR